MYTFSYTHLDVYKRQGLTNLFVLLLSTKIAASLMFPILSGGNVVLTSLISVWGFHEKLNRRQLAGIALGVASIILLSL